MGIITWIIFWAIGWVIAYILIGCIEKGDGAWDEDDRWNACGVSCLSWIAVGAAIFMGIMYITCKALEKLVISIRKTPFMRKYNHSIPKKQKEE